jgi:hypothetical protein
MRMAEQAAEGRDHVCTDHNLPEFSMGEDPGDERKSRHTDEQRRRSHMQFGRTVQGILIGEKFLSFSEALDLLQWLDAQQEALLQASQVEPSQNGEPGRESPEAWTEAELKEMISEDEQILRMDF